jgi:hypothetical protein
VQSSSIINTYRSAFRKNIFGYQIRSSVLSMLGWANESGSRNEGHREDGSSIQKKGEWERKIIPKRWRLGNAQWARLQFVRKFSCKAPVYHNCRIFAGDGRLLCYCDRKKLEWLVSLLLLYPSRPQWFSILLYLLLLPAFKMTTQINCRHVP